MKVLWLFAHPEQRSLSASLRNDGLRSLSDAGHEYQLSDLYAMGWNPIVDAGDYGYHDEKRLLVASASKEAYDKESLSDDIRAEHDKLRWADTVIVQFPFWWFGMPAILKGYFDRVFVKGFAYGVRDEHTGRTLRYGNGGLRGKRAMVVVTVGAPPNQIGPRGIDGDMNDMLYPLHHGTLFYPGMTVVPPFVIASADRVGEDEYCTIAEALRERLLEMHSTKPLPFRAEAGGDYDDDRVLLPDVAPGRTDLGVHSFAGEPARECHKSPYIWQG